MPLAEHDMYNLPINPAYASFNSRAPRGARLERNIYRKRNNWFQFTCPSRSTTAFPSNAVAAQRFQFTCPSRSTTRSLTHGAGSLSGFQFTCPSRSTTPDRTCSQIPDAVSIHVPLAEHDAASGSLSTTGAGFNSRAPRGARPDFGMAVARMSEFQFTCPSRSTTRSASAASASSQVSIHVPLAEHD